MNAIAYFSDDTVLNALNWRQAATRGYALLKASVPTHRRTVVRYEDLVSDPEEQLRRLCAFLDEPFEPAMLDFYKTSEQYMAPVIRTPSVTRSVNTRHVAKWKADLSAPEIGIIESICAREMRKLGYALTGAAPDLPSILDRWLKTAYWHLQQWRHPGRRGREITYPMFGRTRKRLSGLPGRFRRQAAGQRTA